MSSNISFKVVGDRKIHCVSCEAVIMLALKRIAGIEQVMSSAKTQHVTVSFDDNQTSADQVQAKLTEIGFAVEPIAS